MPGSNAAALLALEVDLLAAELDYLEQLIAAGILPAGATREPSTNELRAGVRFAELDRIVNDAAGLTARKADRVRDKVLDGLAEQLGGLANEVDPWAAVERLADLTDPSNAAALEGLADTIADVRAEVTEDLTATAHAAAAEAISEAARQGVPASLLPDPGDVIGDDVRRTAAAQAAMVAKAPAVRLLDVAATAGSAAAMLPGATGLTVLEAALDGAEAASRAGVDDQARQAANVAHGAGRAAAQAAMPEPAEVYASELLDRNTCGPCEAVDGRTYDSLASGLEDYPGAGGYIACDGGSRCRGTLVIVHDSEATPTQVNPGDGGPNSDPGGPGVDPTRRGPTGAPRPPHVAPDGSIIPRPPDPGVPTNLGPVTGDLAPGTGTTVMPVAQIEPPIVTAPPATVPRDPVLAELTNNELDAILVDAGETLERQLAAADELDQRAAGVVTREEAWVEEALDDETLARYAAEQEAWEKAGGYAADATYGMGPGVDEAGNRVAQGRLIDRVRDEWAGQLHMDYLAAEDVTRGVLVAAEKEAEYRAKYGASTAALFEGPARQAYYYASRELRDHWETIGGRPTFAEYAVERGVADAKMTERARKARIARDEAATRAEEGAGGAAKRAAQRARRGRGRIVTEGDRLEQARRRRDRIRAAERKQEAKIQAARDPLPGGTPDAPAT